jgi:hypothetical protein
VLLATYVVGPQAPQFFAAGPVGWIFFLVVGSFYTLTGVGAVLLLRGSARGKELTLLAQLPQLVQVRTSILVWYITNGASLTLNWEPGWVGFRTSLGSQFSLFFRHGPAFNTADSYFAVNLVPVVVLYALLRPRKGLPLS